MATSSTIAKAANSRVFLIEGRARPDHAPVYEYTFRMLGISQGFGDIERIENPDPYEYGKFDEVGQIRGATERVTTTLEGRYAMDLKSTLLELAREGCSFDVQLHFGACTDPSDFQTFEKALILEEASLTAWNTEDLGALQSDDNAVVNETADLSAKDVYEVLFITIGEKGGDTVTTELVDVTVCDTPSCGECEDESDGCEKIYAVTVAAGGSPTTPPDVVFSTDGGVTWAAHDIETMLTAENPSGIACVGDYVSVVSNDTGSLHYALKSEFEDGSDPDFTEVSTGFVAGGEPNAIFSIGRIAFICGDNGYIYKTTDASAGVSVLDAGSATVDNLNDIHAFSEDVVVAVGQNGTVVYTENGETFAAVTKPVGVGVNLNCVFAKSETEWWVGTSTGSVYYTLNRGSAWTLKAFPNHGSGVVRDIQFSTDSVAWIAHDTATPAGRIMRSYDGGYQWQIAPEATGAVIPANDRINALAVCSKPNFVVGVGLADNGTDGFIAVGA